MDAWMWGTILAFLGGMLYTMITIFNATSSSEHSADMAQAITNVTVINLVLVLVLAGAGYFYTQQYPTAKQAYIMFMLHLNLLLSITSVSVAALYSVSN